MRIVRIDFTKAILEQIDLIVDYLKRGQVIAYPTDTIYGLGCDAGNAAAIEKIKKIKEQKDNKPMLALISDFEMLKKYCLVGKEQLEYLKTVWPGAVTVILDSRGNLPKELTGDLTSLAVRLPKNEFLIKIISKAGFPIVSTSLNKTGQPPLLNARELEKHFSELPDLIVDARIIAGQPSRLVDLRDPKNIKVIRK